MKKGFTLIELMVSLFIAMVVFAGVFLSFQNQKILFTRQEMIIKMNRDTRTTLYLLTSYIKQAGISIPDCVGSSCSGVVSITANNNDDAQDLEKITISTDADLDGVILGTNSLSTTEEFTFIVDSPNGRKTLYLCAGTVNSYVAGACSFILDNITVFDIEACDDASCSGVAVGDITHLNIKINSQSEKIDLLGNNRIQGTPVMTTVFMLNRTFQK